MRASPGEPLPHLSHPWLSKCSSVKIPCLPHLLSHLLEHRYKITDIIGKEEGLGVENLRGSGMIAGESSLAYEEVITMNLVSSLPLRLPLTRTRLSVPAPMDLRLSLCLSRPGHLQGHRHWRLPREAGAENHSGGELPHHPDGRWGPQQGQCWGSLGSYCRLSTSWLIVALSIARSVMGFSG